MRGLLVLLDLEDTPPPILNSRSQFFYGTKGHFQLSDMPPVEVEAKWFCGGFSALPEFVQLRDFALMYKFTLETLAPEVTTGNNSFYGLYDTRRALPWQVADLSPEWGLETEASPDGGISLRAVFRQTHTMQMTNGMAAAKALTHRAATAEAFLAIDNPAAGSEASRDRRAPRRGLGSSSTSDEIVLLQTINGKTTRLPASAVTCGLAVESVVAMPLGKLIVAEPITGQSVLANAAALRGHVAVMYAHDTATLAEQASWAYDAGATAVILVERAADATGQVDVNPPHKNRRKLGQTRRRHRGPFGGDDDDDDNGDGGQGMPVSGAGGIPISCLQISLLTSRRLLALPEAVLSVAFKRSLPAQSHTGVTENDVLFETYFPDFAGTLSLVDAERLASMLTAPHLAIPLVLEFFAQVFFIYLCSVCVS
jgi:hypothetical protein